MSHTFLVCLQFINKMLMLLLFECLTPCLNIYNALQHPIDEKLSLAFPIDIQ